MVIKPGRAGDPPKHDYVNNKQPCPGEAQQLKRERQNKNAPEEKPGEKSQQLYSRLQQTCLSIPLTGFPPYQVSTGNYPCLYEVLAALSPRPPTRRMGLAM